jgi:hypothetical protein
MKQIGHFSLPLTEEFRITGDSDRLTTWSSPFLVVRDERIPLGDDRSNRHEYRHETQTSQLDQDQEIKPPPDLAPIA